MPAGRIPDRSDAIMNGGPSPLPAMVRALAVLERCGAGVAAIPCNTHATVRARVYTDRLSRSGIECLAPEARDQERVTQVIRSIKAAGSIEQTTRVIDEAADRLIARGAASVILGCSELPLAVQGSSSPFIDATEALARTCVEIFKDAPG